MDMVSFKFSPCERNVDVLDRYYQNLQNTQLLQHNNEHSYRRYGIQLVDDVDGVLGADGGAIRL